MPDHASPAEAGRRLREPALIVALSLALVRIIQQVVVAYLRPGELAAPILALHPPQAWFAFALVGLTAWCLAAPSSRRARALAFVAASLASVVAFLCVGVLVASAMPAYRPLVTPGLVSEWVICAAVYGLSAGALWFLVHHTEVDVPDGRESQGEGPVELAADHDAEAEAGPDPVWRADQAVARSWSRAGDAATGAQADQWGVAADASSAARPAIDPAPGQPPSGGRPTPREW